jgi:hypothetical protein
MTTGTSKIRQILAKKAAAKLAGSVDAAATSLLDAPVNAGLSMGSTKVTVDGMDGMDDLLDSPSTSIPITLVTLEEGEIDPRLKLLSHSSRTLLHKCPRKYQLYRLSSEQIALASDKEVEQGVTFAYGKAVGVGVQSALECKSEDQVIMDTFMEWDVDLLDSNPRQAKSFWLAIRAVQKIRYLLADGFLDEYELVYYQGKPAVELSFSISLPNGFKYRGFVDAVLRHKGTGEVLVLENKTSSGTANSATFKNSGQALGYSVILDKLFPNLSSYEVLYIVYETKTQDFVELPFKKTLLQRALWLQELLIDTQLIELYESYKTYPMHGEACFDFFRDCEYLSLCTLNTSSIAKPLTTKVVAKIEADSDNYDFLIDFYDLVASQVSKAD